MSGRRIVVTGGAGFLGSHLCEALLAAGDEVVAIDNLVSGRIENVAHLFADRGFVFQNHDVSNYVHVSGPVDAILHFASPASPADFERIPIPILKVGSRGTHHTLGLAKEKGARYLLASTSEVYGDPLVNPQPETYWGNVNPIGPRGVYDEAKRFAEAMTMAYHRHHGVDVRIVRIFNSILADESVLYDDGRELRRETVAAAAERQQGIDLVGVTVPAFDAAGRVGASTASALLAHPTRARCFQVHTAYGRTIRVTGDHSLFVEGRDGAPTAKPVTDLRRGDRVAIAARIEVPERDRPVIRLSEVWDRSALDPWSLLVCAPGLGQAAWSRRRELFGVLEARGWGRKARHPTSSLWGRIRAWREHDRLPLGAIRKLGIAIPPGAHVRLRTAGRAALVPETVEISDEMLWLLGLLVAEECIHERLPKSSFLTVSCDRETLARARKVVERELNLHVVETPETTGPETTGRSAALFVHSRLLVLLLRDLGFDSGPKRIPGWVLGLPLSRLKWFLEGYREGDGVHSGLKLAAGVGHEFSTTSTDLKDDLIVAFARFGLVPSVGRYHTTFKQRTGDRRYPFWRLTLPDVSPWSPLDWDRGAQQRLVHRRWGDLVWAPVTVVTEVPPTPLVYDFSVPGKENFWAGGGVMAKNTFGPRMRPDDGRAVSNFLVQALAGKPLTVYGDGTQTRSFCYVDDEVRGILALLDSDHVGPVNIGNPDEHTILELAEAALRATGSSAELAFEPLPVDDPARRRPDITLARELLGWEPVVPLEEGLARTAAWFRGE